MNAENVCLKHPFTCIVAGPTQSGKSTFVRRLLNDSNLIDVCFDYIFVFLGTRAKDNAILSNMRSTRIVELTETFPDERELKTKFVPFLTGLIDAQGGSKARGCLIFDDLMKELGQSGLLVNLFIKDGSHSNASCIFTTQNAMLGGSGRAGDDVRTMYANTHALVLFRSPMDQGSVLATLARRMGHKDMVAPLNEVLRQHRYVMIRGDQRTPDWLRFSTDLFSEEPVRNFRIVDISDADWRRVPCAFRSPREKGKTQDVLRRDAPRLASRGTRRVHRRQKRHLVKPLPPARQADPGRVSRARSEQESAAGSPEGKDAGM